MRSFRRIGNESHVAVIAGRVPRIFERNAREPVEGKLVLFEVVDGVRKALFRRM